MNQFQRNLYNDLMKLCENEAFYYVDQNVDGKVFRVFTYRLASYTEFCLPSALECRGHTFLMDGLIPVELVSLPPAKFFNAYENPLVMDLDFSEAILYMDKRDGSLISTVRDRSMPYGFRVKSKTSFTSDQAVDAYALLLADTELLNMVLSFVHTGMCVNFELTSPKNRIVIGYEKPELRILNVREISTGWTIFPDELIARYNVPNKYLVDFDHANRSYEDILNMTGIEGFVVLFKDGNLCKVKTDAYCALHKTKDSINNPKALFQACLFEASDDLRSLFHDDALAMKQITAMENLVRREYNHRSAELQKFYDDNKSLSRKDYAILGQQVLKESGTFSLAMNLYLGKEMGLRDWMLKNYREFGITDAPELEITVSE